MTERILTWLTRWGVRPTWPALARIGAWFAVGLILMNVVLPDRAPDLAADAYNAAAPDASVRSITSARGDPRGFTPTTNDGVFKIAWIAGSEIQSIGDDHYTFLPIEVRKELQVVDGKPVSIDMYFVSGMRLVDEYAAVLAAINDGVDAIVVSLNPVWVLNDLAVHGWDNLDPGLAVRTLGRPAAWPVSASLLGPSDLLWGLAARLHVIDDRYQWGAALQRRIDRLTLVGDLPADAATDEAALDELDQIHAMTIPVEFWGRYAPTVDPSEPLAVRQAALFGRGATSQSDLNSRVLDLIGDAVSDSGIPTLVYTAAVSDDVLDDPAIATQVETIEGQLADHAPAFDGAAVTYDPQTIARRVTGMTFNDVVHVDDMGGLPAVMAGDLCQLLTRTDHHPECAPA